MPRRKSNPSTTSPVQPIPVPVIPGIRRKGRPRGRPMQSGDDPRRNKDTQFGGAKGPPQNPGGKPVKTMRQIREEYMGHVPLVIGTLAGGATGIRPITGPQVQASKEFLDRIVGKVPLPIIGGGADEPAVNVNAATLVDELRRLVGEPVKAAAATAAAAETAASEDPPAG
jgi:hypothetical protein